MSRDADIGLSSRNASYDFLRISMGPEGRGAEEKTGAVRQGAVRQGSNDPCVLMHVSDTNGLPAQFGAHPLVLWEQTSCRPLGCNCFGASHGEVGVLWAT